MTPRHDPDVEAWIQTAREADILEVAGALGAQLKRSGSERVGPCPRCGGEDRFAVKPADRIFNCRGGEGGDVIKMVQHVKELGFIEACEFINNEPKPNSRGEPKPVDDSVARERREERRAASAAEKQRETERKGTTGKRIKKIFDDARPISGTQAEAYLHARGLKPPASLLVDLRFTHELDYRGHVIGEDEEKVLGAYPCMLAAIRNLAGEIIGLHRTYLDPGRPNKLTPPGDRRRNKAKKVFGAVSGGFIRLGAVERVMAIGEGIETSLGWYQLGVGPDEIGLGCAVSLGNIAGAATGTIAHPKFPRRTIYNGEPDMARPGMILPDEVAEAILLGDGDSDPPDTCAKLLTGARRIRALGKIASIHMAPLNTDWAQIAEEAND